LHSHNLKRNGKTGLSDCLEIALGSSKGRPKVINKGRSASLFSAAEEILPEFALHFPSGNSKSLDFISAF